MERGLTGSRELVTIRVDDEIELRPVSPADCDELYAAIDRNRERLRAWLPWVGLNFQPKDLLAHLEQRERDNVARTSLTTHIHFQGRLCGAIGLHAFDLRHRSTSVGYWLDHLWEGHGIMTRACRAIVTEGFHHYGLHRIEIRCGTGNVRSLAIPRRLGFIEEGISAKPNGFPTVGSTSGSLPCSNRTGEATEIRYTRRSYCARAATLVLYFTQRNGDIRR